MDVESPHHLQRLTELTEIKAALLVRSPEPGADCARYERAAKNHLYWPVIEAHALQLQAEGRASESCQDIEVYGRRCWRLVVPLSPAGRAPVTIAVTAADGRSVGELIERLQSVSRDYWFGSSFFK